MKKTHVVWIGALKYTTKSIKTKWKLNWGTSSFKLLGIIFHVDLEKMLDLNFNEKIEKIKNSIQCWKRRKLTILGRITVVKSLLLPMLTHLFVSLPNPTIYVLNQIQSMFNEYVWQGTPKIKSSIFVKSYAEGGLKMVDISCYMKSLKVTWFRRYICMQNNSCYDIVDKEINFEKIFNYGKDYIEIVLKQLTNCFLEGFIKSIF